MVETKYKAGRDIELAARGLKTTSPTAIQEWIKNKRVHENREGKKQQVLVSPQSISMWFKRHPNTKEELDREIAQIEIPREAITEDLFQHTTFEQIDVIRDWQDKMIARGAKPKSVKCFGNYIKRICQGILTENRVIENWGLKHPKQLALSDGMRYITELSKVTPFTRMHRLALRNFFRSRNLEGWDQINAREEVTAGKYAHLFVSKENLLAILDLVKDLNFEAFKASLFAYTTGARLTATLEASSEYINHQDKSIIIYEKAIKGGQKRRQEKFLSEFMYELIRDSRGKIFNIDRGKLDRILRSAYKAIIPDLEPMILMPFHFWRHQFAQHMLRETGWNYALVARLGHWTVQVLEKYYGKMDRETVKRGAARYLRELNEVVTVEAGIFHTQSIKKIVEQKAMEVRDCRMSKRERL